MFVRYPTTAACALILLLIAMNTGAEAPAGVIDPAKPLRIVAETVVADEPQGVTTYEGNVRMLQAHTTLRGDRVVVFLEDRSGERYLATGTPAQVEYYRQPGAPPLLGRAAQMRYELATERLDLVGEASLDREVDHLEGDRIVYHVRRDTALVMGTQDRGDRVRATFHPPPR